MRKWLGLMAVVALVSCGGGSEASEPVEPDEAVPEACSGPPVELGGEPFDVSDAVVLRTPIVPGEMAFGGAEFAGLQSKAEVTPLAAYTLYLADAEVDREVIVGRGLGEVEPAPGTTLAVLRIVPTVETGLVAGDVVTNGELGYVTNNELVPLTFSVLTDAGASPAEAGQVEVLQLDDEAMCVAFDMGAAGAGTVLAPVIRSEPSYFFT